MKQITEVVIVEVAVLVSHYGATDAQINEIIQRDISIGSGMWTSEHGSMSLYTRRDARGENERHPRSIRWPKKARRLGHGANEGASK